LGSDQIRSRSDNMNPQMCETDPQSFSLAIYNNTGKD
jgi:hypothetical protein